jgi:hypothetical protein
LTARLEQTTLSEKTIEEDLSRVEESATKSTYRLGVGFERCEKKSVKSAPKFVPSSSYHKEDEALKPTKAHYPSNPKSSFNLNREARKETPKPREEVFICMFCGRAGHLDEFCFQRKRIERRRVEYARDSYRDEFIDFMPHSYSHVLPRSYSRVSSPTFYVLCLTLLLVPCLSSLIDLTIAHMVLVHERTALSLDALVTTHVLVVVIVSHIGLVFLLEGYSPHFESRHLDGPRFPRRGSRPTRPSGEVQRTVKTSSGRMVKCWIPKIYLTNPSTEPSTFSHPV